MEWKLTYGAFFLWLTYAWHVESLQLGGEKKVAILDFALLFFTMLMLRFSCTGGGGFLHFFFVLE